MSDPFKRQLPGYRGRGKNRTGGGSLGGQCQCCTSGGTKREQNRRARAKLKAETHLEVKAGLAEAEDIAHEAGGTCGDPACWCADPCPMCGAVGCDYPYCENTPWAAIRACPTNEEVK